jgi:hypothetical protein
MAALKESLAQTKKPAGSEKVAEMPSERQQKNPPRARVSLRRSKVSRFQSFKVSR